MRTPPPARIASASSCFVIAWVEISATFSVICRLSLLSSELRYPIDQLILTAGNIHAHIFQLMRYAVTNPRGIDNYRFTSWIPIRICHQLLNLGHIISHSSRTFYLYYCTWGFHVNFAQFAPSTQFLLKLLDCRIHTSE